MSNLNYVVTFGGTRKMRMIIAVEIVYLFIYLIRDTVEALDRRTSATSSTSFPF